MGDFFSNLSLGFGVALSLQNLGLAFLGCLVGTLIGVLISVTTIPAAANIGIAAALDDWDTAAGSAGQLVVNLAGILVAGTLTLYIQRLLYRRRKRRHATGA